MTDFALARRSEVPGSRLKLRRPDSDSGRPDLKRMEAAVREILLALSAAASYASRGIRVNVVAPGMVETPLTARLRSSPASAKASASMHALGRIGRPEEVAEGLAWLLGPSSAWVSGVVLPIDGGLARLRPPIIQGEIR